MGDETSDKELFTTPGKTTQSENEDGTDQTDEIRSPMFITHVLNYTRVTAPRLSQSRFALDAQ